MENSMDEGLEYWLRWQVAVCALIIVVPAIVAVILICRVKRAPLNSIDLWIPCWRGLNPIWLLIYRAFVFVFMSCLLFLIFAFDGGSVFYFYTQWTFSLVVVYFALGTIISAHGCWEYFKTPATSNDERDKFLKGDLDDRKFTTTLTSRTNEIRDTMTLQRHSELEEIKQRAGFWGYLMQIIYQTCAGAVMLTDVVFWCILLPFQSNGHFNLDFLTVCMHSLNAVFLLLDTSMNNLPFPWFGLVYFVFWSTSFIIFHWVLHASGFSWWPYAFLELSNPWAPLWYFFMALIHIPCYVFYYLLVKAKNSIFSRLFSRVDARSY